MINYIESMNPDVLAAAILAIAGIGVLMLVNLLLDLIGNCLMFRKAGESGWKAFIPFLNDFTKFRLYWKKEVFFVYLTVMIVNSILPIMEGGAAEVAGIVASLVLIVVVIKKNIRTAHSFGKGGGMALLLTLIPGLGSMILGCGKAAYSKQPDTEL